MAPTISSSSARPPALPPHPHPRGCARSSPPSPRPKGPAPTLTDADDHLGNGPWTRGVSQLQWLPCNPVHVAARPYQPRPGEHTTAPAVHQGGGLLRRGRGCGCIEGRTASGRGGLRSQGDLISLERLGQESTHVQELDLSAGSLREIN